MFVDSSALCFNAILLLVQIQKLKAEIFRAPQNPKRLLLDLLHLAGYQGPLANHIMAPESSFEGLDATAVQQFVVAS